MKAFSIQRFFVRGFGLLVFSCAVLLSVFSTGFYGREAAANSIKINVAHVSLRPHGAETSSGLLWLKNVLFSILGIERGGFSSRDAAMYDLDYPALDSLVKAGSLLHGTGRLIDDITTLLENEAAELISFSGVTPELAEQISYAYYQSVKPVISATAASFYHYHSPVLHLRYHRPCQLMIVSKFPMTTDWQYIAPYEKEGKHTSLGIWQPYRAAIRHDPLTLGLEERRGENRREHLYACDLPVRIRVKGTSLVLVNASITSLQAFHLACRAMSNRTPGCPGMFFQHMRSRFSPDMEYDTSVGVDEVVLFTGFWGAGISHHCKKDFKNRLPRKFRLSGITEHMGVIVEPVQAGAITLTAASSDKRVQDWYKLNQLKPPECDYMADFIGYSVRHKSINLRMSPLRALKVTPEPDRAYGIVFRTVEIAP